MWPSGRRWRSENRRLVAHEIANAQVPMLRILTDCGEMAEWLKAAVLKTGESTFGLPQIAPKLVVSGGKPADHKSVPAGPDPPFADTITAQFTAQ
jgi:hypothetical protein